MQNATITHAKRLIQRKDGVFMARSVSMRTSVKLTSVWHNNRMNPEKMKNYGAHIDFSKSKNNLTLVREPIRDVYEEEFHDAVLEYNKKQKRKDRKISTKKDGYFRKVCNDLSMDAQREFIFQFGRKEDEPIPDEMLDKMYTVFLDGFRERHPNLRVFNAVVHHDEIGVPHLHVNAVPIATGYKRGMSKRPSFSKMLEQEGVEFKDFCENERKELAAVMKQYTGEDRMLVGTHDYLLPQQYRDLMKKGQEDIQKLKNDTIKQINEQNNNNLKKLKAYKNNLEIANKGLNQKKIAQEKQANELSKRRKELDTREADLNTFANDVNEKLNKANEMFDKVDKKQFDVSRREMSLNARESSLNARESSLNAREASLNTQESEYDQKVLEFRKSIERQQELNSSLIMKLQDLLRRATDRTLAKLNEIKSRTERLKQQNQSDFITGLEDLNRIADVPEEGTQKEFNKNLKKATDRADLNFIDFGGLDDEQL